MSEFRPGDTDDRWCDLVNQVGSEIAAPLTRALDRVLDLAATGRIDRPSLRALREELEQARRVAMVSQQLARVASGMVRQQPERMDLARLLRQAVQQRGREPEARGLQLRQVLEPAEVAVDASLLFSLLDSVLDWSFAHARSPIEFRIDHVAWPSHARLSCRFAHCPVDETSSGAPAALESLPWHLAQQIARAMGVTIARHDDASRTTLTLEFPEPADQGFDGVLAVEIDTPDSASSAARPLAGRHVLVLAARADVRARVRDALRPMDLVVDFVGSVEEAREFCRGAFPHAVVYESVLGGERFEALRTDLLRDEPTLAFIELDEEGDAFAVSGFGGAEVARVGRDAIATGLPSALLFELSRSA